MSPQYNYKEAFFMEGCSYISMIGLIGKKTLKWEDVDTQNSAVYA